MPDGLSVLGFAPAMKIIGRTIGKIFNRLYTVLIEGGEHSRRYAWNILESVFKGPPPLRGGPFYAYAVRTDERPVACLHLGPETISDAKRCPLWVRSGLSGLKS